MPRFACLIALWLGFASACFAQVGFVDPIVVEVEAGKFAPLKVEFPAKIVALSPTKPASLEGRLVETKEGWALTLGGGVTRVSLLFVGPADANGLPQLVQIDASLKGTPEPGPDPDDPDVDPDPDDPDPPPSPAPIPANGLHVLIVYETGEALPSGQQAILFGESVRNLLEQKCQTYTDGSKAFRIYDQNVDVSADWEVWKGAMTRPRQSVPWVIVSNGKTGFEGPLPATPEEFVALVNKYEVAK